MTSDRWLQLQALFDRALYEAAYGPDHPETRRTIEQLAAFYRAWGKPEEAEELEQPASPQP